MSKLMKYGIVTCIACWSTSLLPIKANCICEEAVVEVMGDVSEVSYKKEERYPQTILHDLISDFLFNKNSEKIKKVFILGYDGFREDMLKNTMNMAQSGIQVISKEGGLYHSYAGANGEQETSTAPGWLSILSGEWAFSQGVVGNNDGKPAKYTTILDDASVLGYQSTFISSWNTHFDTTYREDILNPAHKVIYQKTSSDEESIALLQNELSNTSKSSMDVIFATLEFSDHAGHTIGYGNQVDGYITASQQTDRVGYQLIQTIYNRDTYPMEDWLILITSDHGGIGNTHGGQSDEERNTWFAINKEV